MTSWRTLVHAGIVFSRSLCAFYVISKYGVFLSKVCMLMLMLMHAAVSRDVEPLTWVHDFSPHGPWAISNPDDDGLRSAGLLLGNAIGRYQGPRCFQRSRGKGTSSWWRRCRGGWARSVRVGYQPISHAFMLIVNHAAGWLLT